jgi:hypothetical protein
MQIQLKLFRWSEAGNHVVMIVRGQIYTEGFDQIAQEIIRVCHPLANCKVIIDLQDATYRLEAGQIQTLVDGFKPNQWPAAHKIALVSSSEIEQYDRLLILRNALANHGLKVAVFRDPKVATKWLADTP